MILRDGALVSVDAAGARLRVLPSPDSLEVQPILILGTQ